MGVSETNSRRDVDTSRSPNMSRIKSKIHIKFGGRKALFFKATVTDVFLFAELETIE